MKLPGWSFILVGGIVAILSGYIYFFVTNNGQRNASMAFFFFVGMIFILIGVVKTLFRKIDETESTKISNIKPVTEPPRRNRVEEQLYGIRQEAHQQRKTQHVPHSTHHQPHHIKPHTSNYAKAHPYHGIQETKTHQTTQPAAAQAPSIILCKCGTKNYSTSNFCHKCGTRLK